MILRLLAGVIALTAVLLSCPKPAEAATFQKDYTVEYFLTENGEGIEARAVFNLKLTNLSGEVMIKNFSLAFPKSFTIRDLAASNNGVTISPQIVIGEQDIRLTLELPNAEVGRGTANNLRIEFNQDNLFKVNGNVWEVILPTIDAADRHSYKVVVHLPSGNGKKVSVAKPEPDSIDGNTITWADPESKTVYAVFGERQYYKTRLTYHLANPKLTPVYTDIALVPETAYQKTYIENLQPAPSQVYLDEDGNYMARYVLKPKESYRVVYDGVIELSVKPREETRPYIEAQIRKQAAYLTLTEGFWHSSSARRFAGTADIYAFVTGNFTYNYDRVGQDVKRLGAQAALANPANAVCTEFTDSFIALARSNGFYAREIQGYGFSNDPQLRPISEKADILHSWPEYFDREQRLWIPVDPTWENTSGIDYYRSLDLNHIAFVIHGRRPDYPYPAGTYKQDDTRDIAIEAVPDKPEESVGLTLSRTALNRRIYPGKTYSGVLTVKNTGNTYAWNIPVSVASRQLSVNLEQPVIPVLAPYEEKNLTVTYAARPQTPAAAGFDILLAGGKTARVDIQVTPFYLDLLLTASPVIALLAGLGAVLAVRRRPVR